MLKFIIVLIMSSILYAQSNFNLQKVNIISFKDGLAVTNNPSDIAIGVSGIIVRNFPQNHQAIIASVEVLKKSGDKLYLKMTKFDDLKQDVLPTYNIKPKVGDEVILNYHYNRALAIMPDKKSYDDITQQHSNFDWVHPDLFASYLAINFKPNPTKESFKEECKEDSIGLLIFKIENSNYFVDCKSFKIINKESTLKASSSQTPFYSRVENIKGRLFGLFGGKGIKNYNNYYKKLLNIK